MLHLRLLVQRPYEILLGRALLLLQFSIHPHSDPSLHVDRHHLLRRQRHRRHDRPPCTRRYLTFWLHSMAPKMKELDECSDVPLTHELRSTCC
uniref:Secreted protein n=1 Tax=Parascaris univalens TaxID=6257 RepID=A0A914ZDQ9_PARUN